MGMKATPGKRLINHSGDRRKVGSLARSDRGAVQQDAEPNLESVLPSNIVALVWYTLHALPASREGPT